MDGKLEGVGVLEGGLEGWRVLAFLLRLASSVYL